MFQGDRKITHAENIQKVLEGPRRKFIYIYPSVIHNYIDL